MTKPTASTRGAELVPFQPISRSLVGTIDQKITAFDQVAANMAQLSINGWDSVQKCKAACWLADGKDEHPAVFMENHYCMMIKGRLTIEPKWEYMVRRMKETVPGFRYDVLIETDDACKIRFTDGKDTHEVEYTLADAKRQGLLGRGENAWTTGSTREMCFKQVMKRGLRRLGVGRSTPWVEVEMDEPEAPRPPLRTASGAEVIEDAVPAGAGGGVSGVAPEPSPASPPASEGHAPPPEKEASPVTKLGVVLRKMYGAQKQDVVLQKASMLYNEAMKAKTGVEHAWIFRTPKEIGPVQAKQILDYLATRKPEAGATEATGGTAAAPAPAPTAELALETEYVPPVERADDPPPVERAEDRQLDRDLEVVYTEFLDTVKRAKALFGRKFMVEGPPGSGVMWFVDDTILHQAGRETSLKVFDNGEVLAAHQDIVQINRILAADCDRQERGGR